MAVTAAESPNSFPQSSTGRLEVSKFSSLKTLAMPTEATKPAVDVNVPGVLPVGRFSGDYHWPDLRVFRNFGEGSRARVHRTHAGRTHLSRVHYTDA